MGGQGPREPEIAELDGSARPDQDVLQARVGQDAHAHTHTHTKGSGHADLRFHVAMDDAMRMQVVQGGDELDRDPTDNGLGQPFVVLEDLSNGARVLETRNGEGGNAAWTWNSSPWANSVTRQISALVSNESSRRMMLGWFRSCRMAISCRNGGQPEGRGSAHAGASPTDLPQEDLLRSALRDELHGDQVAGRLVPRLVDLAERPLADRLQDVIVVHGPGANQRMVRSSG